MQPLRFIFAFIWYLSIFVVYININYIFFCRWVIKARVMNKSAIRTWSNSKGEGKLFSMDLFDESGEIRATAFKEQCDKFYDMIQVLVQFL